jgi:hypothetical protein
MDSGTHKQSAALTTGHGIHKKRSGTFKQVTASTRRGAAPSKQVTAPSQGYSSFIGLQLL